MAWWPVDRPDTYDPDKWWDEDSGQWVSTFVTGPGSYVEWVVIVGDKGHIYYRGV